MKENRFHNVYKNHKDSILVWFWQIQIQIQIKVLLHNKIASLRNFSPAKGFYLNSLRVHEKCSSSVRQKRDTCLGRLFTAF